MNTPIKVDQFSTKTTKKTIVIHSQGELLLLIYNATNNLYFNVSILQAKAINRNRQEHDN
jgi:hypothetical protein